MCVQVGGAVAEWLKASKKKNQNISSITLQMHLNNGNNDCVHMIRFMALSLKDLDIKASSFDLQSIFASEEGSKSLGFYCRAHDDHLQFRSLSHQVSDETQHDVCVCGALVGFVDYDYGVLAEKWV